MFNPQSSQLSDAAQQCIAKLKSHQIQAIKSYIEETIYIPLQASPNLGDSSTRKAVDDYLTEFCGAEHKVLLLLGDAGGGKSLTLKQWAYKLWHDYKPGSEIPLWLDLSAYHQMDRGELIENYFKKVHAGITEDTINELKAQKWLLLLDGFDEMPEEKRKGNLYIDNNWRNWNLKAVISCRTQAIIGVVDNYKELFVPNGLNDRHRYDWLSQLALLPFTYEVGVKAYIAKYCERNNKLVPPWNKPEHYYQSLQQSETLKELVTNPFMLCVVLETLPTRTPQEIARFDHYDWLAQYVDDHFARESDKIRDKKLPIAPYENVKAGFIAFAEDLAIALFCQQCITKLTYRPNEENNPWARFFAEKKEGKKGEYYEWQRRGCLLLERHAEDQQGEYYTYEFRHKTLLEYFALRVIERELTQAYLYDPLTKLHAWDTEKLYKCSINQRLLRDEVDVLQALAKRLKEKQQALLQLILLSRERADIKLAAANAATILNYQGFSFAGLDLATTQLPGADLSGAILDKTNLQGADLRHVRLVDSFLHKANFKGSKLAGIYLGQLPYLMHQLPVNSIAFGPDGRIIASGSFDNTVRLWRVQDGTLLKTLRGHNDWIESVAFSSDGKMLASGSKDNTVRLWNVADGKLLQVLQGHSGNVDNIAFSSDLKWFASSSEDHDVQLWQVQARGNTIVMCLKWRSHNLLNAYQLQLQGAKGLSAANAKLLAQHGADDALTDTQQLEVPTDLTAQLLKEQQDARNIKITMHPALVPAYSSKPEDITQNTWQLTWLQHGANNYSLLLEGITANGQYILQWLHGEQGILKVWHIAPSAVESLLIGSKLKSYRLTNQQGESLLALLQHQRNFAIDNLLRQVPDIATLDKWPKAQSYEVITAAATPTLKALRISYDDGYGYIADEHKVKITIEANLSGNSFYYVLRTALARDYAVMDLDLTANNLDDKAIVLLAGELSKFTNLKILRLSNNKITEKGLDFLLKALPTRPSLQHILLDNNYIYIDERYAKDTLLADLSKATQLQNLDLAMNFIQRGATITAQTSECGSVVVFYDKSTLQERLQREQPHANRTYCKTLFRDDARLNSPFSQPMPSIIAPESNNYYISPNQGVIGLFAYKKGSSTCSSSLIGGEHVIEISL